MKTKLTVLKAAIICILMGVIHQASAQTNISAVADFANANMTSATQVICMGKDVELSVPTLAGTTYKWLTRHPSTDGTTAGTGVNVPTNTGSLTDPASGLTTPGYYIYKLQATNTTTNCSEVFDQLVYVLPTPVVTITAPTDVAACTNVSENILLTASATASSPSVSQTFAVTYQWYSQKQGGGAETLIPSATSNTYTVATGTDTGLFDYYAKVTYVIKNCGETLTDKKTVTVTAAPTKPTITIASN